MGTAELTAKIESLSEEDYNRTAYSFDGKKQQRGNKIRAGRSTANEGKICSIMVSAGL
jgi:hypothetical protein